jgi:gliding motility-associated lipoprotein GldK
LNDRACFLANFKPLRGDYAVDQAVYTVEAKSYLPNDYNLYNMAGNVAEWTNSSYNSASYEYVSSLNPNMSFPDEPKKVVRGGSWKDVAYYLRVSSRDYEYSDTARSYIGFRTVQDYLGSQKVKIK